MMTQDAALLNRWQQGRDADAFTTLVQRYSSLVYAASVRVLGDAAQAEEVAQECFLELMNARGRVRVSLGAWLHTIAVRRSLDRIKGEARRRRREAVFGAAQDPVAATPDASLAEILAQVDAAIQELPAPLREAMVGRFLEGQSHAALAQQFSVAESTVRYRVEQAVARTREHLRRGGVLAGAATLTAALTESATAAPPELATRLGRLAVSQPVLAGTGVGLSGVLLFRLLVGACLFSAVLGAAWFVQVSRDAAAPDLAEAQGAAALQSAAPSDTPEAVPTPDAPSQENPALAEPDVAPAAAEVPPYAIRGGIYDEVTGAGIPGIRVRVHAESGGVEIVHSEPSTDAGAYWIPPLDDGAYALSFERVAKYPALMGNHRILVTLTDGNPRTGIDFALKPGVPVAGVVRSAAGAVVAGAEVGAMGLGVFNPITSETGADGAFVVYLPQPVPDLMLQAQNEDFESVMITGLRLQPEGLDGQVLVLDQPRTASVRGVVVDGDGYVVKGAQVRLKHATSRVFGHASSANTDEAGKFHLKQCPPGDFSLIITPDTASGFSTSDEHARISLATGEQLEGLEIVFGEKGGEAVAGHVLDSAGKPVAGATIIHFGDRMDRSYSDKEGWFTLTGLPEGPCHLEVEHYDYSRASVATEAGTLDLEIVLQGHGSVAGQVLRADTGAPLRAFSLAVVGGEAQNYNVLLENGQSVESADGTFSREMGVGMMSVAAWAPGFAPAWETVLIEEGAVSEVILRLEPVPPYEGVVLNAAGAPVANAVVYFMEFVALDRMERAAAARSKEDGSFVVESLPRDARRLCAFHPDYAVGVLDLPGNGRIILPEGAVIEGRAMIPEANWVDYMVHTHYPDEAHLPGHYLPLPPGGKFTLERVTPGLLDVTVRMNAARGAGVTHTIQVESGRDYDLQFEFSVHSGELLGALRVGDAPVSQANLELERWTGGMREQLRARADQQGAFRFENVWSGALVLRVRRWNPEPPHEQIADELEVMLEEGERRELVVDLPPVPWDAAE